MILRRMQLGRSKIGRSCHDLPHQQWTHHFLNRSSQGMHQQHGQERSRTRPVFQEAEMIIPY